MLRELTRSNRVWSMALHYLDYELSFDKTLPRPDIIFSSRKRRTSFNHIHTRADPFLLVFNDELFIFYETKAIGSYGQIEAKKTRDMVTFTDLGTILKLSRHISYPAVFGFDDKIYMIPESGSLEEVGLFRFNDFPYGPEKVANILSGKYVDTSPFRYEGMWYLFTTSPHGLEIYYTKGNCEGPYLPHPLNPITSDPRFCRSGGLPVLVNGQIFRIAQDCSRTYGGNLNIMRVLELSASSYREELTREGFFNDVQPWGTEGGHHLSIARFHGRTIVATDGKERDYLANKYVSPFFTTMNVLTAKMRSV